MRVHTNAAAPAPISQKLVITFINTSPPSIRPLAGLTCQNNSRLYSFLLNTENITYFIVEYRE
jgi:hypothetical protein